MSAVESTLFACLLSAGMIGFSGCDVDQGDVDQGSHSPATDGSTDGIGVDITTGEPVGQRDGTLREAMQADEGTEIKIREDGVDIQVD